MKELLFQIQSTICFLFLKVNTPVNGAQFQLNLKRYSYIVNRPLVNSETLWTFQWSLELSFTAKFTIGARSNFALITSHYHSRQTIRHPFLYVSLYVWHEFFFIDFFIGITCELSIVYFVLFSFFIPFTRESVSPLDYKGQRFLNKPWNVFIY